MIRESFEEIFEDQKEITIDYIQTISLFMLAIISIIVGLFL